MLSDQHRQLLAFIHSYISDYRTSPTHAEMAKAIGAGSRGTMHRHVDRLTCEGYLERERYKHQFRVTAKYYREAGRPVPRGAAPASTSSDQDKLAKLSAREQTVLELRLQGLTQVEIAEELGLSRKTVFTHVASMMSRLGCRNPIDLALFGVRSGFLKP